MVVDSPIKILDAPKNFVSQTRTALCLLAFKSLYVEKSFKK